MKKSPDAAKKANTTISFETAKSHNESPEKQKLLYASTSKDKSKQTLKKSSSPIYKSIDNSNGVQKVVELHDQLKDLVTDMEVKMDKVMAKQAYDYCFSFQNYMSKKEQELRNVIQKLLQKHNSNSLMDEKMNALENAVNFLKTEAERLQDAVIKQKKETIKWKTKATELDEDKKFLDKKIMETKRENKVLQLAISRVIPDTGEQEEEINPSDANDFFITKELTQLNYTRDGGRTQVLGNMLDSTLMKSREDPLSISLDYDLRHDRSAQNRSLLNSKKYQTSPSQRKDTVSANASKDRVYESIFKNEKIQNQNPKFSSWLRELLEKESNKEVLHQEITSHIGQMDKRYNDQIISLRQQLSNAKKKVNKYKSERTNEAREKSTLENFFIECVESTRKDIIKRKIKSEIRNKKSFRGVDRNADEAKDLEESILKLAHLAKDKIKLSDFTTLDKLNILELFVNNEKTLLKIYEALFPTQPQEVNNSALDNGAIQKQQQQRFASHGPITVTRKLENFMMYGSEMNLQIGEYTNRTSIASQDADLIGGLPSLKSRKASMRDEKKSASSKANSSFENSKPLLHQVSNKRGRDDFLPIGMGLKISANTLTLQQKQNKKLLDSSGNLNLSNKGIL